MFAAHQVEDLDHARLDDLGELEGRDRRGVGGVGDLEHDVAVGQLGQRHAVALLDALRLVGRDAEQLR
jgi:hypothetical protein